MASAAKNLKTSPTGSRDGPFGLQNLRSQPELAALSADLLWRANHSDAALGFLSQSLPLVLQSAGADFISAVSFESGKWQVLAEFGPPRSLPSGLLADALDRESAIVEKSWIAVPLAQHAASGEVLLFFLSPQAMHGQSVAKLSALTVALGSALETARTRENQRRRIERLETILTIASQWNQTNEMEPLLVQMAEAATKLLKADRASIFLWDRPNHTLVGRPALGVKGGELRIPDGSGVVGQVVQTGEPRRINVADQAAINRQVDRDLGYQTRTLLCVPLRASRGELFGAFEVINKLSGDFSTDDESALVELAARDNVWIKLSGADRLTKIGPPYAAQYSDVVPFAHRLIEVAPERMIWGSDWPHTGVFDAARMPDDGALVDALFEFAPDETVREKILVDNPRRLLGL